MSFTFEEHHRAKLHVIVERMKDSRVLVLGDPMLDVYHHGNVTRISQEAPVVVFEQMHQEIREGGACNVLKNVRALGAHGDAVFPIAEWTKKHRYLANRQQVFRHDEDIEHASLTLTAEMCDLLAWCQVIIWSDYGKGTLSADFCRELERFTAGGRPIVADPRGGDWNKYSGATVICPNEHEWEQHRAIKTGTQPVFAYQLQKLGRQGMVLFQDGTNKAIWQSHTRARQVYDVTGAGDTVIAAFAAAFAEEGDPVCAAELANMAAGVVVGKVGTATCSKEELHEEIDRG